VRDGVCALVVRLGGPVGRVVVVFFSLVVSWCVYEVYDCRVVGSMWW